MLGDTTHRRLSLADLRKPFLDLTQELPAAPRPVAAPKPPPKVAKPPQPQPPPSPVPGGKTEAQRAKAKRHRQRRQRQHAAVLRPQADELLLALQARYPVAFDVDRPQPFALGSHHQIIAETGCDQAVLKLAMAVWCLRPAYAVNAAAATHRVGLDGTAGAELTTEERATARTRLDVLQAKLRTRVQR